MKKMFIISAMLISFASCSLFGMEADKSISEAQLLADIKQYNLELQNGAAEDRQRHSDLGKRCVQLQKTEWIYRELNKQDQKLRENRQMAGVTFLPEGYGDVGGIRNHRNAGRRLVVPLSSSSSSSSSVSLPDSFSSEEANFSSSSSSEEAKVE